MVCFSYDDIESWVSPYGADIYLSQMERLRHLWKEGMELLEKTEKTEKTKELLRYANVVYCHYLSDILQTKFALSKRKGDNVGMINCLREERKNSEKLLSLMREDAKIGYEASNHYFYTERNILEKIIRTQKLEEVLVIRG
jgi:hypothetical protein